MRQTWTLSSRGFLYRVFDENGRLVARSRREDIALNKARFEADRRKVSTKIIERR